MLDPLAAPAAFQDSVPRQQTLLVLGAGPKALAIAAKRIVLRRLGFAVPELVIVDRQGVAAHWSGAFGYTDGRRILGTVPEKDVGYPYASTVWGDAAVNTAVDAAMQAFSWPTYLVETGAYADYIDRGRPRPTHTDWSAYLTWVAARAELQVVRGEVVAIETTGPSDVMPALPASEHALAAARWRLRCRVPENADGKTFTIEGDGLVLTGPGTPVRLPGQPADHPRVLDGDTAWRRVDDFARLHTSLTAPITIGVVGTGETAAAIVVALVETLGEAAAIEVLTPRGVLYSRDEGFDENRVFSDPDANWVNLAGTHGAHKRDDQWPSSIACHKQAFRWSSLTEADRREFVRRTDRGVFSVQAMSEITRARNVRSVVGTATRITALPSHVEVDMEYGGMPRHTHYDYLVVARGFDPLWFTALFDDKTAQRLRAATGHPAEGAMERAIQRDLSVAELTPALHLPMLAAVAQGPGFPNLSCLGLLADRVLSRYVPLPHAPTERTTHPWEPVEPLRGETPQHDG